MPSSTERQARLVAAGLFLAGFAYLYAASLHRFTPALQYTWVSALEILQGRHPYRDYHFLIGPAVPYIQALFFKVLGVSYAVSYVSHAALFNGLACAMTCWIVWLRTKRLDWAAAAGALPIVWFYAVFMAVPFYDHEAHGFILAAVLVLHWRKTDGWRAFAGLLAAAAFFCKQSHGAFGLIFLCFYLFITEGWRAAAAFTVGGTLGVFAQTGAMTALVGWKDFWHGFVEIPMGSGRTAFARQSRFWLIAAPAAVALLGMLRLRPLALFVLPLALGFAGIAVQSWAYLVFLLPLLAWPWLENDEEKGLVLTLVLVQLWGRLTSNNEIKVYQPFMGLLFGILCAVVSRMKLEGSEALARRWLWASWGFLMLWGLRLSYLHKIHNPFPGTTVLFAVFALALLWGLSHEEKTRTTHRLMGAVLLAAAGALLLRAHGASRAHRADPAYLARYEATRPARSISEAALRGVKMTEGDAQLEALLPALRALPAERKPFFAYLECDILYRLAGQELPAFWWFDPTSTFKPGDGTEDRLIAELSEKYRTFVWCPPYSMVDGMPKLSQWLDEHATFEKAYGPYRVHEIRP